MDTLMPPDSTDIELEVLQGRNAGAVRALPLQQQVLVGNDLDCDVCLLARDQTPWKIALLHTSSQDASALSLSVLVGEVSIGDKLVADHTPQSLSVDDVIHINGTVLGFRQKNITTASADATGFMDDQTLSASRVAENSRSSGKGNLMKYGAYLCLAGGLATLLSVAILDRHTATPAFTDVSSSHLVASLQSAELLSTLHFHAADQDQAAMLEGRVNTRKDINVVNSLVAESPLAVIVNVQVDEELKESVQDVFRVNGIEADVQITGIGTAEVNTYTNDLALLNTVKASIKRDLSTVQLISITNQEPVIKTKRDRPSAPRFDSDKQVTLVVAGNAGYMMTRDLSRYFVGSLLPSGHTVKKIHDGNVVLRKNGEEVQLLF